MYKALRHTSRLATIFGLSALAAALAVATVRPGPANSRHAARTSAARLVSTISPVDAAGLQKVIQANYGKVLLINFWAST